MGAVQGLEKPESAIRCEWAAQKPHQSGDAYAPYDSLRRVRPDTNKVATHWKRSGTVKGQL